MYNYDRRGTSVVVAKLTMGPGRHEEKFTELLRRVTLQSRSKGDFNTAMLSAGYHAKKQNAPMYVYPGNSYMHLVWRVSGKQTDALNAINNTGNVLFVVSPDLSVARHDVHRPPPEEKTASDRPKYPDGRLVPVAGEAVYQMVPGMFGMGALIEGLVTQSRGGLRVKTTGGGGAFSISQVSVGKSYPLTPAWTVGLIANSCRER